MKRNIVLFFIFIFTPMIFSAQEIEHIEHLNKLDGKITTYHCDGIETKAVFIQSLLTDAVIFFETEFRDTFDLQLLVLDRDTWKYYSTNPWPLAQLRNDPYRIIMPDFGIYKIKEAESSEFYGNDNVCFWDFICVHELGHYISKKYNSKSYTAWSAEFFANYVQITYMKEKIPEFSFPSWGYSLWKLFPLKYKSLDDFERNDELNPFALTAYHEKFYELCFRLYEKHGIDFMHSYINTYSLRNKLMDDNCFNNLNPELMIAFSKEFVKRYDAEVFVPWERSMHKNCLYYIVLTISLLILVLSVIFRKRIKRFVYVIFLILSVISVFLSVILFILTRI